MSNSYVSREFFHFVGRDHPTDDESNYSILEKVLDQAVISHHPHDSDWGKTSYTVYLGQSLRHETLIAPTITCYCDIPIGALGVHVAKYGAFGVSFPREFVIRYGARPVIYFPLHTGDNHSIYGSELVQSIEEAYRGFIERVVNESATPTSRSLNRTPRNEAEAIARFRAVFEKDFLAFLKPFNSDLPQDDPDNFYMEREWRKYGNLIFAPQDVAHVIVADSFVERASREFPDYEGKIVPLSETRPSP